MSSGTIKYIEMVAGLSRSRQSIEAFLLQWGRPFPNVEQPPPPKSQARECYRNAALLAMSDASLTYCEGFAVAPDLFPMSHAWVVRENGTVLDPTWPDGNDYFGVAIKTDALARMLIKSERYGILFTDYGPGPLLKMSPKKLREAFADQNTPTKG